MQPTRLARIAHRELLLRRLPHGLLGWRYLWPGRDGRIRVHRRLWWDNGSYWPRPLWLLVQVWLWLRWVLWFAWRATWRAVRRLGPELAARDGLPLSRQAWRVLRLALGWCIPPGDSYGFGLVSQPAHALDHVYDQELPAYHRWRSSRVRTAYPTPRSAACAPGVTFTVKSNQSPTANASARLQDKLALAAELTTLGIPLVPTLAVVARSAPVLTLTAQLAALQPAPPRLFCKMRSGNQGRGAFTVWPTPAGLAGCGFDGQRLDDTAAVEAAWRRLLDLDAALIQPCLANHPRLAAWAGGDALDDDSRQDAITIRYISQWWDGQPRALSAVLEVPRGRDADTRRPGYCLLPIDPATGQLRPWPHPQRLPAAARQALERLWTRIGEDRTLPDWPALVAASHQAQTCFPMVWAIAWDWVLTPDGPVLLEGNRGWGVAVPQQLLGGLLTHAAH